MPASTKALIAAALLTAGSASADPILGTWKTETRPGGGYGLITVSACGPAFCGTISGGEAGSDASANDLLGKRVFWDMKAQGGGAYAGGKVYDPERDLTANGRFELSGRTLTIRGCILGVCQTGGRWTKQ